MPSEEIKVLNDNFSLLFQEINKKKREAELEFSQEKIAKKVGRFIKAFKMDYPKNAQKVDAEELFKKIENILDNSQESSEIKKTIDEIRKKYDLQENSLEEIKDFETFIKDLSKIKYSPTLSTQETLKQETTLSSSVSTPEIKTPPIPPTNTSTGIRKTRKSNT